MAPVGLAVSDLMQLALRRNTRRAHLLVSTVLAKHIPVAPNLAIAVGRLLGQLVAETLVEGSTAAKWAIPARAAVLEGRPDDLLALLDAAARRPAVGLVLGFAETATALGHFVADQLDAEYLQSTRRAVPGTDVSATFEEGHSHATTHLLLPVPAELLDRSGPLVLVDDEISTGRTALATIMALHERSARDRYVVASLIDVRSEADRAAFAAAAAALSARIDVVSMATGTVELPPGFIEAALTLVSHRPAEPLVGISTGAAPLVDAGWPRTVAESGRHGCGQLDRNAWPAALATLARQVHQWLAAGAGGPGRLLIVGTEELMALPLRLAAALSRSSGDAEWDIRCQSTTRSPVYVRPSAGYPVQRGLTFPATDTPDGGMRYLYNACWPDGSEPEAIVLVVDAAHRDDALWAAGGPVSALERICARVLVFRLPTVTRRMSSSDLEDTRSRPPLRGPAFGSYRPQEVGWLLTDLSGVDLEGAVADRELAIQSGRAHYAESLPVEYRPAPHYRRLFEEVLVATASRLAEAVGLVTELVLAERGPDIVLASLARAGTPVGILMRRWASFRHALDLPHYAVSIVRGRGIDEQALDHLARHHDPAAVVFVDGWTGKGAIARELTAALAELAVRTGIRFSSELAVLADPGHCTRTFGTRDDFLIASACLNSTVSGLVSRTVLNRDVLSPGDYHGAKCYREMAADDVSNHFLDVVSAAFPGVVDAVTEGLPGLRMSDREPTFSGWAAVEGIRVEYDIPTIDFVKPGVGETTRVLLRRIPWRILLRENDNRDHLHLRLLAADRGVPIEIRPDIPFSCIGLIKPVFADDRGEG